MAEEEFTEMQDDIVYSKVVFIKREEPQSKAAGNSSLKLIFYFTVLRENIVRLWRGDAVYSTVNLIL